MEPLVQYIHSTHPLLKSSQSIRTSLFLRKATHCIRNCWWGSENKCYIWQTSRGDWRANLPHDECDRRYHRLLQQSFRSARRVIIFAARILYRVGLKHTSYRNGLAYACVQSAQHRSSIKRAFNTPTVDANLALPPLLDHGISMDDSNPIVVDTIGLSTVISVSSSTSNGQYSPGDVIGIAVIFSNSVDVSGHPYLTLDVGLGSIYFEYTIGDDGLSLVLSTLTLIL